MTLVDKDLVLAAIMGEYPDAHYPQWYASKIEKIPAADVIRWIPVNEGLPKYRVEVITINRDDEYEINHIIDEEDGEWFFNGVVAWMPIPEPSWRK